MRAINISILIMVVLGAVLAIYAQDSEPTDEPQLEVNDCSNHSIISRACIKCCAEQERYVATFARRCKCGQKKYLD